LKFGVAVPNSGPLAGPDAIRQTAQKAEELGLDSVWVHDHISYGTEWLGHRASGVSEQISPETEPCFYESLSTLNFIAGFTKRIDLGIGVLVLPLRNPLVVGRQLITLQGLSEHRLVLGVAIGDYPAEFKVLGVPYRGRVGIFEEYLEVLHKIFHGGSVGYHGNLIGFDHGHFYPRVNPPPILIGGGVAAVPEPGEDQLVVPVLRRVARLGNGWMPDWGKPENIAQGISIIRDLARSRGRGNIDFQVTFSTTLHLANSDEEAVRKSAQSIDFAEQTANIVSKFGTRTPRKKLEYSLIGSARTVTERVEQYADAGVTRFKMMSLTPDVDSLLRMMEKFTKEVASSF